MTATTTDFKDGLSWAGQGNSATIGPFTLLGGKYGLASQSSGTNSVTLNVLMPDGSTFQAVAAAQTAAFATYDLPPGEYEIIGGAAYSAGQGSLIRIPYRRA